MAVPDEDERAAESSSVALAASFGEHVLPDRVACAGVEEIDALDFAEGLQTREEPARLGASTPPSIGLRSRPRR